MSRPHHPATAPRDTRLRSLTSMSSLRVTLLSLGLLTIVAACGAADATSTEPPAFIVEVPVVPTTAPIALPPDDVELPAVAPAVLPTAPAIPARTPAAGADVVTTDAAVAEATDVVPATEADVEEAASPAGAQPDDATPTTVVVASADRWNPCVVSAAQAVDATVLLDHIAAGTESDLTSVQLNGLAAASVPCGIVTESLALSDLAVHVDSASACMNGWLESTGGGAVFTGLASVGFGQPTPSWAQGHFASAITNCFSGYAFASEVIADVSADPTLAGAFDID